MASAPTYPGVYIQEIPSGVRTITGVATSITAFVGRALRGPVNEPVRVQSFAEYTRVFGGLWRQSTMSYAVDQFFRHGGRDALIVRVFRGVVTDSTATIKLPTASGTLELAASSPGRWGALLRAIVDHETRNPGPASFNLRIEVIDPAGGGRPPVATEQFRNLSADSDDARFVRTVLSEESALVGVRTDGPAREHPTADPDGVQAEGAVDADGEVIQDGDLKGVAADRTGIHALDAADLFNLLCIPPRDRENDVGTSTWVVASAYCQARRAMLIVDSAAGWTANPSQAVAAAETGVNTVRAAVGDAASNAMLYFPRLRLPDRLSENRPADFAPCGAVAGIIARTDAQRGVWKAPAGLEASFSGVERLTYTMTDDQNGRLNPLGLNCLRTFRVSGHLVWGARTLDGADVLASEWKYVPVRRLALYLEESLYRALRWVVFEPNDEPLWAQIRLNVGAFMQNLFRQGAFQGSSPRDAYFVKCDAENTTQNDRNLGIVNIDVGFAPLKPAEFVILRIQQMAGQVEA